MKGNVTSLEQMVEEGKLVYDFDTTSKGVNYEKTRIGRVLKEYSDCFEELLLNREDSHLWLRCSILRMKLNNLLLERLLRDLRKRCNLHIRLLSGANAELYEKRALDEIAKLERKVPELNVVVTADVERHWAEGEVHALEMEFYQQKDYKACKGLWDKLREEETRLKLAIENKEASSNSVPPAKGMRVPPIGFPVDIGASLPLATVDPDFIVLGFCALVLIGGTLYFWFKDDGRDDDGDSGGGEKVSKIKTVSGLKELVPLTPATPDDFGVRDVNYFDFYGRGDGENSICRVQTIVDDQTIEGKELLELVPTTHDKAQSYCLAKNTIRKYLLLTLNHAERENRSLVTAADIIGRLNSVFNCKAIIISKELHRVQGHHLHIGVRNENASKNTVNQRIRELFPEFEGRQCNVSAHRIWDTVCQYILKQDNTPVVWGEESLEEIKNRLDAKQKKKEKNKPTLVPKFQFSVPKVRFSKGRADNVEVLRRLSEKSEWTQVLKDELLGPRCVTNYNNLRQIFIDVRLDLVKNSKYLSYLPNKVFVFKNLRAIYLNQFGFLWLIFFLITIAFRQMNFLFLLKQLFEIYFNQWFTSATQWFTSATFLHEFFIHFEKEFAANFEIDKEIIATFKEKLAANNIIPETNSSWATYVILIGVFCYIIYVLSSQN